MSYYPIEAEPLWSRYSTHAVAHTIDSYSRHAYPYPYPVAISVNGPVGGMWWVHTNSNWNAVCHAGVVGATLAAVTDRAIRAEVVASAEANLPYFVSGFTDDGYCTEGIGYWSYGFGHHVLLGEAVSAATGGRLQLVQGEKLERVAAGGRRRRAGGP
mgnify:CR=1 FL=1